MKPHFYKLDVIVAIAFVVLSICCYGSASGEPAKDGHSQSIDFENFPVVDEQPLFEELVIDGPRVGMWNRVYSLKSDGLLSGIRSGTNAFLSGPMLLTGRVNGKDIATARFTSEVITSGPYAHIVRSHQWRVH